MFEGKYEQQATALFDAALHGRKSMAKIQFTQQQNLLQREAGLMETGHILGAYFAGFGFLMVCALVVAFAYYRSEVSRVKKELFTAAKAGTNLLQGRLPSVYIKQQNRYKSEWLETAFLLSLLWPITLTAGPVYLFWNWAVKAIKDKRMNNELALASQVQDLVATANQEPTRASLSHAERMTGQEADRGLSVVHRP